MPDPEEPRILNPLSGTGMNPRTHGYLSGLLLLEPQMDTFFFFFLSFLAASWHMEFLGQGLDPSCSRGPKPQLWQTWILNPLCWAGDRT